MKYLLHGVALLAVLLVGTLAVLVEIAHLRYALYVARHH